MSDGVRVKWDTVYCEVSVSEDHAVTAWDYEHPRVHMTPAEAEQVASAFTAAAREARQRKEAS